MGNSGSAKKNAELIKEGQTVVDFLKKNAFFRDVKDTASLNKAASMFELVRIEQKEGERTKIIAKGDIGDRLYIVARGTVEVTAAAEDGSQAVLRRLISQDVFTEIGFIHSVPSTVSMFAVKPNTVLLRLSKSTYIKHKGAKYMKNLTEWLDATAGHMVSSSLKNVPMLAGVPEDKLGTVAKLFELKVYSKGEKVFSEGDPGDAFYILTKGKLCVTSAQGGRVTELSTLRAGQSFGEISLVDEQQRTATVSALEDATLFMLSRTQFKVFLEHVPSLSDKIRKNINERSAVNVVASKIPFFQTLEPNKLHLLGTMSKIQNYPPGSTIMMEGRNKPTKFFMITEGEVEVTFKDRVIRTMKQGEYFGEISLVSGRDATATVKAVGTNGCVCLEINRDEFDALFVGEPGALAEIQIKVLGQTVELKHLLVHPIGRKYFEEYSKEQFAQENIDFWMEVEELERQGRHRLRDEIAEVVYGAGLERMQEEKRKELAKKIDEIYTRFIQDDSDYQVNIKSNVREEIKEKIANDDLDYDLYRRAKNEIYELMSLDVFSRFKQSDAFKKMLDEIGVYGQMAGEDLSGVKDRLDQRSKSIEEKKEAAEQQ